MNWQEIYGNKRAGELADGFFREQKKTTVLNGWFRVLEIHREVSGDIAADLPLEIQAALRLKAVAERLPLAISDAAVFAGTQNDGFSSSYALIHPLLQGGRVQGLLRPPWPFLMIWARKRA